jgi:hypothetical protein
MDGIRRVSVSPGISEHEMERIWKEAEREARMNPGTTSVILFASGTYPLPVHGVYVYGEESTVLRVHMNSEVWFSCDENGKLTITYKRKARERG